MKGIPTFERLGRMSGGRGVWAAFRGGHALKLSRCLLSWRGIGLANSVIADVMASRCTAGAYMSEQTMGHASPLRGTGAGIEGRRRQLRALLLSAADTARQVRRRTLDGQAAGRPMAAARAIRDRISSLLSAAS